MAKAVGTKNKQIAEVKKAEVIAVTKDLTLDSVANKIANTQVEIQKTLANLSTNLSEKLAVLRSVEEAIALKKEELQQLHNIEATATTADELAAQIQAQRDSWTKEQQSKEREWAERDADRKKTWGREAEEHAYKVALERQKDGDGFAQKKLQLERDLKDKQEQLEKGWAEREAALKARETELAELRAKVAALPEEMKKEVAAREAQVKNAITRDYETKMTLLNKDAETEKKLAEQRVKSAEESIVKLTQQIGELRAQMEQAHRDVKEISAKALESASGRHAMEAMQNVLASSKDAPTKSTK
jgi:DNA repair exonuclease SbcCD ATPase subunit